VTGDASGDVRLDFSFLQEFTPSPIIQTQFSRFVD
jgi:hypothetical protein